MANKFYAVKVGRQTGIFNTWPECDAQVKGFSGAVYKSFTNLPEAEGFLSGNPVELEEESIDDMKIIYPEGFDHNRIIQIFTDGACSGNPGPGGWGVVLMMDDHYKEMSGYQECATNNQMELLAAIKGLKELKKPSSVILFSDSMYLVQGFNNGWLLNWKFKTNWKTAKKEDVKNVELWEELYTLSQTHKIAWHWVKGHASNKYNNRCDIMATSAIKNKR